MQQVKVNNTPNKTNSKHRGWDLLTLLACSRKQHYHIVWQHEGRAQGAQSLQGGRETEWASAPSPSKHDSPAQCFASTFLRYSQHPCPQDAQLLRLVKVKKSWTASTRAKRSELPTSGAGKPSDNKKHINTRDIIVMFREPVSIPFQTEYWNLQE